MSAVVWVLCFADSLVDCDIDFIYIQCWGKKKRDYCVLTLTGIAFVDQKLKRKYLIQASHINTIISGKKTFEWIVIESNEKI